MITDPEQESDQGDSRDKAPPPALPALPATIRFRRWLRQLRLTESNPHVFTEGSAILGGCSCILAGATAVMVTLIFAAVVGLWLTDPLWGLISWPPLINFDLLSMAGCWCNRYGFAFVAGWGFLAMWVVDRPIIWVPLAAAIGLCAVTASCYNRTYPSHLVPFPYAPPVDTWREVRCVGACMSALFWGGLLTALWYLADYIGFNVLYAIRHPIEALSAWRALRAGQNFQTQTEYLEQVAAEEEAAAEERAG